MKKYIYFHICCINEWKVIVGNILNQIKDSGLYEEINEIRCSVIGDLDEFKSFVKNDFKIRIVFHSDSEQYMANNWNPNRKIIHNEQIILDQLHEDSQKEEFYALYIHSKGVKRNRLLYVWDRNSELEYDRQNEAIKSWVDYMLYFAAYRHKEVFKLLQNNDTTGVNLYHFADSGAQHPPGYSYNGNFWWATSSYIRTLKRLCDAKYCGPEWWITSGKGRFISMYYSQCDLYQVSFPRIDYEGKPLMIIQATADIKKFNSEKNNICQVDQ